VDSWHFHELTANLHDRIEAGHRVLIDHSHATAADLAQLVGTHLPQVVALEQHTTAGETTGPAEVVHYSESNRRLAATGFADKAHGLAMHDPEAHAGDDVDLPCPRKI
jgi:hypothetical protein